MDAVAATVSQTIAQGGIRPSSFGLAIPGHVDDDHGVVRWAPNFGETIDGVFRYWLNVGVREPLERRLGLPVRIGNDANLAALGEYRFGSGNNSARCLVMITLGTGIGGGVVLSSHAVGGNARGPLLLLGGNKGGAELGHTVVLAGGLDCNAGTYGAIEAYCQRDGIVNRAIHRMKRRPGSLLEQMVEGDLAKTTPRLISEAANQGDELSIEVWTEVGTYLGVGIGNFINIFAPDVVAIGGQVAKAGELILEPVRKAARNVAIMSLFQDCRIVQAQQIDEAGILGAAALALEYETWA
ncbi:MAG: Glucokinase [Fimbriimonadaceae bacterium]|nr:Glucokinase [Fimbriimonadaceae bacterium]